MLFAKTNEHRSACRKDLFILVGLDLTDGYLYFGFKKCMHGSTVNWSLGERGWFHHDPLI